MNPQIISFCIGYKTEKIIFSLRMISKAEDDSLLARFTEIKEKGAEKNAREYRIYADSLSAWTVPPTDEAVEQGKELGVEILDTPDKVRDFFKEQTNEKEYIASYAVGAYRGRLVPDIRFF
jgi:hypothetical protein